jgi:hypothetical protein
MNSYTYKNKTFVTRTSKNPAKRVLELDLFDTKKSVYDPFDMKDEKVIHAVSNKRLYSISATHQRLKRSQENAILTKENHQNYVREQLE